MAQNLADLLLARRGLDWTLVEMNKAISLSGLTCMMLSFLPYGTKEDKRTLLWLSMNSLWVHSVYSTYKFYSFDLQRFLTEKLIRRVSICLGAMGQVALSLGFWGQIPYDALIGSATVLGMSHFWTYEVDYKYVLQVRPYAYLPFPLAAGVLGTLLYKYRSSFSQ